MALYQCSECGKEISDKAITCPHCGAPVTKRSSLTVTLIVLLIIVIGLMVLVKLFLPLSKEAGIVPAPRWVVENTGGDDTCSRLGDYCMRSNCLVRNVGDAAGSVTVTSKLISQDNVVAEKSTTVRLEPGNEQKVGFEFFEAELGREYKSSCSARELNKR